MIIAKICEVNPRNILIRNLRRKLFVSEKYLFNLFYATSLCLYLPKTSKNSGGFLMFLMGRRRGSYRKRQVAFLIKIKKQFNSKHKVAEYNFDKIL